MNAIVPLNIAAIRVNQNDNNKIVGNFQGRTTMFEKMPWADPNVSPNIYKTQASTGDKIYRQLGVTQNGDPQFSPINPLGTGIHLHWELPAYFKKGTQPSLNANFEFPAAPNRWLVTRYLSIYNPQTGTYGTPSSNSWVVESDFISPTLVDSRPAISVPLPANPATGTAPYMYMGRVVNLAEWNPVLEPVGNYLPSQKGIDQKPLYLTSIGFVGAYFSSYYPECCSVFGFWDDFSDVTQVYDAITTNSTAIQFRATYQVVGWINETGSDPMASVAAKVTQQYNEYAQSCLANNTVPELTPADYFESVTTDSLKWTFNTKDISYTLDSNFQIATLTLPDLTLCAGTAQEIVWNMNDNLGTTYFLTSGSSMVTTNPSPAWTAPTELAIGNSTEEALSALLKYDMGQTTDDPDVLANYELLLDALQLGLLNNIEKTPNKLITLEEGLHQNGFSSQIGGYEWLITNASTDQTGKSPQDQEVTLPIDLAEQLYLLNKAEKAYDMARGAVNIKRKQLFMDWVRYIKIFVGEAPEAWISPSTIQDFIWTSSGGELNDVINYANTVGLLQFTNDPDSGAINGISDPGSSVTAGSAAATLWAAYSTVVTALATFNNANPTASYVLECSKAPDFYMPAEPVLIMEGDMIEPPQRNGDGATTFVRLSQEILSQLVFTYQSNNFTVNASDLAPVVNANMPSGIQGDIAALTGEAFVISPMLAPLITTALAAQPAQSGSSNPAVSSPQDFTTSLMYAQGGLSPLDIVPSLGGVAAPATTGLFEAIYAPGYIPKANSVVDVTLPLALKVAFTNAAADGWAPDNVGWNIQQALPEFSSGRMDPFMPIFMIWNVGLNPLLWEQDAANMVYSPTNITDFFNLDTDGVDYQYKMNGNAAVSFTSADTVSYGDDSTMRSGAANVLSFQITNFINNNQDPNFKNVNDELAAVAKTYNSSKMLSQSLGSFNINQVLSSIIPQIAVENLTWGGRDSVTVKVAQAATANSNDDWYDGGFSSMEPIATGLQAQGNFGPLRSGFMNILSIELVDVFGQRMDLQSGTTAGMLECITSYAMSPQSGDTANQGKIYLAPRLESPARMWFKWLSADFDPAVAGITDDFVEMNSHPATSPICGWVIPNHLDNDLFFYNSNGAAIGTFGIEHAGNPVVVYRTRAGNTGDLTSDIGPQGTPNAGINVHLANYMWYINSQTAAFLEDMMTAVQNAAGYIAPSNAAQDISLSVLIGSPLALTRSVITMETLGNLLPLNQADNTASSPFPQDVINQRTEYTDRMKYSSANLGNVLFPVRLGDLANLDDGLVGYLFEGTGANPYTGEAFYSPAAETGWTNGVQQPEATNLQLTLIQPPITITMLVDPRAAVHATTGVLPVNELSIPADQYSAIMNSLSVNFITRPMLQMSSGLVVPLPAEAGYSWSYINPEDNSSIPLAPNAVTQAPAYGYTPQSILEGWAVLNPSASGTNTQTIEKTDHNNLK